VIDYYTVNNKMTDTNNKFVGTFKKFYRDFQEWAYSNEILVAATGFCIGVATKEVIEKILNDIITPLFTFLIKFTYIQLALDSEAFNSSNIGYAVNIFGKLIWDILQWVIIIVMAFVLLEYFLNRKIIGMKSVVKTQDTTDFVKAKVQAHESIVPSKTEMKELEKTEKIEEKAGKKMMKLDEKKIENVAEASIKPKQTESANENLEMFFANLDAFDRGTYFESV
jgi:large-conductance mechanosensitive channel